MFHGDAPVQCDWHKECRAPATSRLINDETREDLNLCGRHRGAALVNLEKSGRLRLKNTGPAHTRPGQHAQGAYGPREKPTRPHVNQEAWEQEAARQADLVAVPLDSEPDPVAKLPSKDLKPKLTLNLPTLNKPEKPKPPSEKDLLKLDSKLKPQLKLTKDDFDVPAVVPRWRPDQ